MSGVVVRTKSLHFLPSSISFLFRIWVLAIVGALAFSAPAANANSKYAGFVIDARTGKVLYADRADARRYPASLTKMMTLYMVFDALDRGKIKKSSRIRVSKHAAQQPPSKLGLRPGQTITVESAIYALVTKSANDVASAVGEFLGGTETRFAQIMTRKAKSLGMKSTVFKNASGLPNSHQVTTARDMAKLGLALREHFPRHYKYFSTRSFKYGKRRYRNHNRLLGSVRGVDGIKTGYTRASGYNLVTSATHGKRSIIAVVMGGKSGKSRNRHMAKLVRTYLPKASKRGKKRVLVASRGSKAVTVASAFAALPPSSVPTPASRPQSDLPSRPKAAVSKPKDDIDNIVTSTASITSAWYVQVASLPTAGEADAFLRKTSAKAKSTLSSTKPVTQKFVKDGITYYRARFAGFSSFDSANKTCKSLKRKKINCFAVSN